MSDIVEELRHWASVAFDSDSEVLDKAAAEIERLRREVGDLNAGWQRTYDHDTNWLKAEIKRNLSQIEQLDARCGRLRDACSTWERASNNYAEAVEIKDAEIKRLRGLLGDVQIILDSHNNIVGNLNGEITRLRGLLRDALEYFPSIESYSEKEWPEIDALEQRIRDALGDLSG